MSTVTVETYDNQGHVIATKTVAVPPEVVNRDAITARAVAALNVNATFLSVGSPSNAQVLAQVQALTKECSGLIRLLLGLLDSSAGT